MLFDRHRLPVIVVARMGQPVEKVGSDGSVRSQIRAFVEIEDGIVGQRQFPDSADRVVLPFDQAIVGVVSEARSPIFIKPLRQGSALIGPILVIITGGDDRAYAREM